MVEDKLVRHFKSGDWEISIDEEKNEDGSSLYTAIALKKLEDGTVEKNSFQSSNRFIVEYWIAGMCSEDGYLELIKTGFTKSITFKTNHRILDVKTIW